MAAPDAILKLTELFNRNRDAYVSGAYKEAQLRHEFIDPFFKALGWDVYNESGYAEAYKDVIYEDAIKVGGFTKAPDYCFRIGGTRKFFVEAKKPSVDIKGEPSPAFQLRRYAWSAKLPLSILTDFEEFAVYDCRVKPVKIDKAGTARILYMTDTDYEKQWDQISSVFSREAVLQGSFDKYAEETRGKKGTAEVDDAFLKEIESWRDLIARNIALRNPALTQRELNFAVQQTIDRIIFLRICEDRGIEEYGRLMALLNGDHVYGRLFELFQRADERYNSGLFHFRKEKGRDEPADELTPALAVDDKPLKEIIKNLYYPDSAYEFSVLPADILGQVYEQFLGKVIRLTPGHRAVVEDKPEVKKAGGVYYTPTYIVDYIVKNTVGKLLEDKTPKQAAKLRILDPACGSGSFLIGAYQYLLDWHRDWYFDDGPKKHTKELYQGSGGDWRLTTAERKRILLDNIYGVDIDPQAVEVTKLSLLLKVLEGESEETLSKQLQLFHERALPDLSDNIKCGNSLIGPDFFDNLQMPFLDDEVRYRVNAFKWDYEFPIIMKSGGFDVVLGNPPYGALLSNDEIDYLLSNYKYQDYQLDTYMLFIEKGISIATPRGFFGMIIPNTWLLNLETKKLRKYLFAETKVENFMHYRHKVFRKQTVDTEILIVRKSTPDNEHRVAITIVEKDGKEDSYSIAQSRWENHNGEPINILEREEFQPLADKLRGLPVLDDIYVITQGTKPFQVGKGKPPQTRSIVNEKPFVSEKRKDKSFRPLLRGSLIQRYQILWNNDYWISFGEWLAEPRYSANYDASEKIVIRQTGDSLVAALDCNQFVVRDNLYTVVPREKDTDLRFILGLLNSRLLNWYYQMVLNPEKGEALAQVKRGHLARLPVAIPAKENGMESKEQRKMVEYVQRMLELNKEILNVRTPDDRCSIERQREITDQQIDQLVYELYGLTNEETKIVEEKTC
jgi:type I restriction-modification system DNA methylase subunit